MRVLLARARVDREKSFGTLCREARGNASCRPVDPEIGALSLNSLSSFQAKVASPSPDHYARVAVVRVLEDAEDDGRVVFLFLAQS